MKNMAKTLLLSKQKGYKIIAYYRLTSSTKRRGRFPTDPSGAAAQLTPTLHSIHICIRK